MSRYFISLIPSLWLGLLIGISFIEAPLKFQAPGITLELGLGIGELVFGVLNKVEWVLLIGLLISAFFQKENLTRIIWLLIGILSLVLIVQTFALFPVLNERIAMIRAGETPPASKNHLFYILGEGSKVLLLIMLFYKVHKTISLRSLAE